MKHSVQDLLNYLHELAPAHWAENYDNVGLYVGEAETTIQAVLVSLDVTEAVLEEAIAKGCNVILSHHPLWFSNRKRLTGDDWVSRLLLRAIRERVVLVACHTNLDNVSEGVNGKIAERMGLHEGRILMPKPVTSDRTVGAGLLGQLPQPMLTQDFLALLADKFQARGIRYTPTHRSKVQHIAICGGSGSFLIEAARAAGAHALVTADVKYHSFFDSGPEMMLIDIGHYESEQFTSDLLVDYLTRRFTTFAVLKSGTPTNPIQYFP